MNRKLVPESFSFISLSSFLCDFDIDYGVPFLKLLSWHLITRITVVIGKAVLLLRGCDRPNLFLILKCCKKVENTSYVILLLIEALLTTLSHIR